MNATLEGWENQQELAKFAERSQWLLYTEELKAGERIASRNAYKHTAVLWSERGQNNLEQDDKCSHGKCLCCVESIRFPDVEQEKERVIDDAWVERSNT